MTDRRPRRDGRRRSVKLAVLTTAVSVLLAGGVVAELELLLRAHYAAKSYAGARASVPHPFLQVRSKGAVDHVNQHGFRGDAMKVPKPAGELRIVTLGGSTTLGVNNPYEDTWPRQLEKRLRARAPEARVQVQNAGASWWTSLHSLIDYQARVSTFEPDVVIIMHGINDLCRSFSPPWWAVGPFQPDYSHYLGPYIQLLGTRRTAADPSISVLWDRVRMSLLGEPNPYRTDAQGVRALRASMREAEIDEFPSLSRYRRYLTMLAEQVQRDRHALLVLSHPSIYRPDLSDDERSRLWFGPVFCAQDGRFPSDESMRHGMQQFNVVAEAVATDQGAAYLDVASSVPKDLIHFSDDVHLSGAGNAVVAQAVADELLSQGMVGAATSRAVADGRAHADRVR